MASRFRRLITKGGTSLNQLQCYLCSICFLVLCAVFSSLFITSSLPIRHRAGMSHLVLSNLERTSSLNKTLTLSVEVSASFPKTTDASLVSSETPTAAPSVSVNSTPDSLKKLQRDSVNNHLWTSQTRSSVTTTITPQHQTDLLHSSAYRRVKQLCGRGGMMRRNVYDPYPYLINEESLCTGSVFLVIAVHSKASYHMRRDLIRQTWGSVRQYDGHRIKVVFFVGSSGSSLVKEALIAESRVNRDLIQRDFVEHYRNMSRKHISVLRWVADYCHHATYFAKVDDDTFVNIFHTIQLLKLRNPRHFMCKVVTGYPVRNARSTMRKWLVTRREYAFKKYPLYCEGFAYLIDVAHVRDLYWCTQFTKFFWIDDIYITGIVAKKLRLARERLWNGHSWAESIPSLASEKIMDYVFVRAGHNEILPHLWMRIWRATLKYSY